MRFAVSNLSFVTGPLARKAAGLSGMTAFGQIIFVLALPLLSRLFTPTDFGVFTVYLSIVNICGPIAGLKFDSALFGVTSREYARPILALAIFTVAAISLFAALCMTIVGNRLPAALSGPMAETGLLIPVGVLLAGMWSTTSAWAVRCNAISTLAIARFLQPSMMTVLQLIAGLNGRSAISLIVAHLISHALYSGFILARTLKASDLKEVFLPPISQLARHAREHRMFPFFVMPAIVASALVSNAPPILLGSIYGADIAGHCGMAYRLASAPIAIVSLSLGHIFTSEICSGAGARAVKGLATKIVFANVLLVCLPILVFGALAPSFAGMLLGEKWAATGQIAFAFSILAAAQALAAPFVEITSVYRFQRLRFLVELRTFALVFAAILIGAYLGMNALSSIWMMSVAGAAGMLIGLASVWAAVKSKLGTSRPGEIVIAPSASTP